MTNRCLTCKIAGQLRVLPHAAEVLNKGSRITACSLHRDMGGFFAPPETGAHHAAPVLCLVCKSDNLDILQLPTMATLLTFCNISEGPRLLSNAPGNDTILVIEFLVMAISCQERMLSTPAAKAICVLL